MTSYLDQANSTFTYLLSPNIVGILMHKELFDRLVCIYK